MIFSWVRCECSWILSGLEFKFCKLEGFMNKENCSPNHIKGSMKPKAKNIETKIKGFSQNQELNNSGFECILLVSTRVLNFTTSTWCQLLMHISTLLCPQWIFFHIFGLFQVGECFFLQFFFISQWWWFFAKKHILHWNMLFPSFSPKESLLEGNTLTFSKLACGLEKCRMGNSLHTTSAKQIVL